MQRKIIVSFPAEMPADEKIRITEQVNKKLERIYHDVKSWNGFVDFTENELGFMELIAKCDNDNIRQNMQEILNADMGDLV